MGWNGSKVWIWVFLVMLGGSLSAQVVTWTPTYPTPDDTIEIIFNAAQGDQGCMGLDTVYAHTGVITGLSANSGDWWYKPANWFAGAVPQIEMEKIGTDLHKIRFHIRSFYGMSANEDVRDLAFVFRNSAGTQAGKNADGSDIFIPIFPNSGFSARFTQPQLRASIVGPGDPLTATVSATQSASLKIFVDGVQQGGTVTGTSHSITLPTTNAGKYYISYEATNGGTTLRDTMYYIVQPATTVQAHPDNWEYGIKYLSNSSVRLTLVAPGKSFAYVIGDFNNWEMDPNYMMKQTPDGQRFWIELNGLTPGQEYAFQYFVDQDIRVGDPWAEKVLDPWNDPAISSQIYPNLMPYPEGKTSEIVSILETGQQPYNWQVNNYQAPDNRDLVIYELLIRDFVVRHDYKTVRDSLSYLQNLGVNAIELMPVMEFDANRSWGYSPAFFFAPDKYYGPEDELKALIDECHARGMAVILDVALNHTFGQSPMLRLYYDEENDKPTANSPWFNEIPAHPYNVGYDFDHTSSYTQDVVDTVLSFWVNEYNIDGFRLDLSKGFTSNYTNNIGDWSNRDNDRIYHLKRMANEFWANHPGKYLILEHFANNDEEIELAAHGFMLWGNGNEPYRQSAMAWPTNDDFEWGVSHKARGWAFHNLVGFMESHDEERLMYENIHYGNQVSGYSTRDTSTAYERMGQVAAFFFTVPGPKMMWQFGELGYDYSIDWDCRTCNKPVRWNYLQDPERQRLMKIYAALIKLKTDYPAFRSSDFYMFTSGWNKQIHINDASMDVRVFGNFDVVAQDIWTGFSHQGWWYDNMTGDSMNVTDVDMNVFLQPGDWHIYTDERLPVPDLSVTVGMEEELVEVPSIKHLVYPNPFSDQLILEYSLPKAGPVQVQIFNSWGQEVAVLHQGTQTAGQHQLVWNGHDQTGNPLANGVYLYSVSFGDSQVTGKVMLAR